MAITAYRDQTFSGKVGMYEAMINPNEITLKRKVEYNSQQAPDLSNPSAKYKYTPAATLSFKLVLDCTGVVDSKRLDLPQEIEDLQHLVYDYQGDIHRPYFVMLRWGIGQVFKGVLTSFDTTYTLFDPDGVPLRATVSMNFVSFLDPKAVAKEDEKASPDMTHTIHVVAGDTLPGISLRVYNSPDYSVQIAQFNGLDKVRSLKPGMTLTCPPLLSPTTLEEGS